MNLEVTLTQHIGHERCRAFVINPNNVCSIVIACEDNLLLHFNTETFKSFNEPITIHSSITCLAWQPLQSRQRHATKNSLLAIGCADGTLVIFTPSSDSHNFSKPEPKKIKAHEGAITKVQWSSDGSSLLSSGEDGEIKVWSQAGHLRSILSRLSSTVHCIAWNYECTAVVSTHNCILSIHNVQNKDVIEWKVGGGDELKPVAILTVDWSNKSNLIACGGEDCKYYIFDERGLLLFTSLAFNNPITNISWLPNGGALFLGSYDELRICSQHGKALRIIDTKSYSSIVDIQCSEDSAQVVTLHDNGLMIAADLIGKVFEWNGVMIEQLDGNQLRLDIMNKQSCEILQISKGPIVEFKVAYHYLIVITRNHCHIYPLRDIKSVVTFDTDRLFRLTCMGSQSFSGLMKDSIVIYSYTGRKLSSIQYDGFVKGALGEDSISLSNNVLALIDVSDKKLIRLFDNVTGSSLHDGQGVRHEVDIVCLRMCNSNTSGYNSELIAFMDKKKDLFVASLKNSNLSMRSAYSLFKIGSQVEAFTRNETNGTLAAIKSSHLVLYNYPAAPFVDVDLLEDSMKLIEFENDNSTLSTLSFCKSQLYLKQANGKSLFVKVTDDPTILFETAIATKWKKSLRFCRFKDSTHTWTTLACLALNYNNFEIAEMSFMAIKRVDKLDQIRRIRNMQNGERKNAEMQLYKRNFEEAVSILLQSRPPCTYRALKISMQSFQWEQALDIATQYDSDLLSVLLWYRVKYLEQMKLKESNEKYKCLMRERPLISKKELSTLKEKFKVNE